MTTKLIDDRVVIVIDPDTGRMKGARRDQIYSTAVEGMASPLISERPAVPLTEEMLASIFPDRAGLLAHIEDLQTQVSTLTSAREDAQNEKRAAEMALEQALEAASQAATKAAEDASAVATAHAQTVATLEEQIRKLQTPASMETDAEGRPYTIALWQLKAHFSSLGLLASADAVADAAPPAVKLAWEYAPYVSRQSVGVAQFGAVLGFDTEEEMADLFAAASAIKV